MRQLLLVMIATALVASGCGMLADPSVSSPEEVRAGLLALQDGATGRVTASLEYDEGELRRVLAGDAEARALVEELVESGEVEDTDQLLAEIADVQALLDDHALLLAGAPDGSGRIAAEYRGDVWADLRFRQEALDAEDPAAGLRFDLQAQVDWDLAAEVLEQPDLGDELATARSEAEAFFGDVGADGPDLGNLEQLVLSFLVGDLVAVGGEITPDLLAPFGVTPEMFADGLGGIGGLGQGEAAMLGRLPLDVDTDELATTALSFGDYRRDGDLTLVDVTVEVRAAAEYLLDAVAEDPAALGMTTEDVQEARAALDDVPDRLQDVAVLRFDDEGTLRGVRVDVLDIALQVARAADADDPDLATFGRVAGDLDATGFFVDLALDGVGTTDSVLAEDPAASVTIDELVELGGALFGGALGGGGLGTDVEAFEEFQLDAGAGGFGLPEGLQPQDVAVGDCFTLDGLFGDVSSAEALVPCDQPHLGEVTGIVTTEAATLEDAYLDDAVYDACLEAFVDYTGSEPFDTDLFVDVLLPSLDRFDAGDRDVACYLTGPDTLTGSRAAGATS